MKCPFHKGKMVRHDIKIKGEPFILMACGKCSYAIKLTEEQFKKMEIRDEIHNDKEQRRDSE